MLQWQNFHLFKSESCIDGSVKLSGSSIKYAGCVEICIKGIWTTLCNESWDFEDAQIVFKELRYYPYGEIQVITIVTDSCEKKKDNCDGILKIKLN